MQNKVDSELLRKKRCERLHGSTCVNGAVPGCVSRPLCKMAKNASNQNGVTKNVNQNHWGSGLCSSFGILNARKQRFVKLDVLPSSGESRETLYLDP